MVQTLSDIKSLLEANGLHPKKRLGQNFLHDGNKMRAILEAAAIGPGQTVLEVGAGTGALTEHLLEAGAKVVAVEMDEDMWPILDVRLAGWPDQYTLIEGDVLSSKHTLNPEVLAALGEGSFGMVANLPYNVASPLLVNLFCEKDVLMEQAVVMLQREVADRLVAKPNTRAYGPLGILIGAMCQIEMVCTLSAGCFWPQPQVGSAVVKLVKRAEPLTDEPLVLAEFLRVLFSKRRKQLGSILGRDGSWPKGITPDMRPQVLPIEQLIALQKMRG